MENKVSELMDGELDNQSVSNIIGALKKDRDLQEKWQTYHLIGDAIRQSSCLSINISPSVSQKLETEPVIFSPQAVIKPPANYDRKQKYKIVAFAIAASVIAMISGGIFMNHLYEPRQMIVAEQSKQERNFNAAPIMVSNPSVKHHYVHPPVEINDYLFVHREFSPGVTVRGHITNVNSTPELHERYGR